MRSVGAGPAGRYKPDTDIKVLKQGFNVDPLLQNQAACISTMIYNEYWQVVDAVLKDPASIYAAPHGH